MRYTEMGIDGRLYDTQRRELIAVYTMYKMGNDGRRCDTQKWELMSGDTIYRVGN